MIPATGLRIVKNTKKGRKIAKNKRIYSPLNPKIKNADMRHEEDHI